ncbi:MAG TPA: methyltransferase domain-containing protein [Solirubrobacteraceae bacterium]|jgi:SAM-dependent methyltransferase|nr:methyltransferase domain-containing protein [Solirubrobacteraceae bacterium]
MQASDLETRIAAFPAWSYRFEFEGGIATPLLDRAMLNRHEQRRRYFFEALLRATGGSLCGRRVLDLGCSAGFWSLAAVQAGADFVLGIDAGQTAVDQAELVFEAKGIERSRYRFERGNVFEHDLGERFDVVLCLGLLDHVAKPVELFELMSAVAPELLVIDTEISRSRMSVFELDKLYNRDNVVDYETVLIPSRLALSQLASQFGFETKALPQDMTDYTGMRDYLHQRRLAFICSKGASLDAVAGEQRAKAPWWVTAAAARRRAR